MHKLLVSTATFGIRSGRRLLAPFPGFRRQLRRLIGALTGEPFSSEDYLRWVAGHLPDAIAGVRLLDDLRRFERRPTISVIVPTYDTDLEHLSECIDSVRSQLYPDWQLVLIDDASPNRAVRDVLAAHQAKDPRISCTFRATNGHIAAATNEALAIATGEFVAFLDHDDLLWPNALLEVVRAINEQPDADLVYSDEDFVSEDRSIHLAPFFKPDWNPDFLHSVNYITHLTVIRRSVIEQVGGLRGEFNGAQDWDLLLRVGDVAKRVVHIPKVLYSWRIHDKSTASGTDAKPYVVAAQERAIKEDLARRGRPDAIVRSYSAREAANYWTVTYPVVGEPLISIVIPSKDQLAVVRRCVDSIFEKTSYRNFEIVLVDTGSTDAAVWTWYEQTSAGHPNFRVLKWPEQPFSYARSCNAGARVADGEILVMLNNDTKVLTPAWLEVLAGEAQRPEIGAAGCLLLYPDGKHIQHAGVGVGLGGVAANSFSGMLLNGRHTRTQSLMIHTRHNVTAVTAACLAIRKEVFDQVGGFDEAFRVTYNDVDLCLRLVDSGYRILYTPDARLLHHESLSVKDPNDATRDRPEFEAAKALFLERWQRFVDNDPNLNANLSRSNAYYDLPPRA